ncbi:MAG: TIGR00725 family protein [Promethearchaeia archaeon]
MNYKSKMNYKGTVAVIGASRIDSQTETKAIKLGRLLAENGYVVSCGGLGGVMQAVCKGAKKADGLTIGIIPQKNKSAANPYVDIAIPVPFSHARNIVVVLSGDLIVAISGKAGTLSELAFAWIYNKKIVALTGIDGWANKMADSQIDDRRADKIYGEKTPESVVQKVNELFKTLY